MRVHLSVCLLAGFLVGGPTQGQEEVSWKGQRVVLIKKNVQIGDNDEQGRLVPKATLRALDYLVLGDVDGWLAVAAENGVVGWFSKKDAMLPDEALPLFSGLLEKNPEDVDLLSRRANVYRLKSHWDN